MTEADKACAQEANIKKCTTCGSQTCADPTHGGYKQEAKIKRCTTCGSPTCADPTHGGYK